MKKTTGIISLLIVISALFAFTTKDNTEPVRWMSIEEAIVASTINGAAALGISATCGSLEVGKRADVVLYDVASYKDIIYHYGVNHVERVWVAPLR